MIASYNVATTVPTSATAYRPALLKLVVEGKVKTNLQISEAVAYLKKLPANAVVCCIKCFVRNSSIMLLLRLHVELELKLVTRRLRRT